MLLRHHKTPSDTYQTLSNLSKFCTSDWANIINLLIFAEVRKFLEFLVLRWRFEVIYWSSIKQLLCPLSLENIGSKNQFSFRLHSFDNNRRFHHFSTSSKPNFKTWFVGEVVIFFENCTVDKNSRFRWDLKNKSYIL